jgi:hypothetical protein
MIKSSMEEGAMRVLLGGLIVFSITGSAVADVTNSFNSGSVVSSMSSSDSVSGVVLNGNTPAGASSVVRQNVIYQTGNTTIRAQNEDPSARDSRISLVPAPASVEPTRR